MHLPADGCPVEVTQGRRGVGEQRGVAGVPGGVGGRPAGLPGLDDLAVTEPLPGQREPGPRVVHPHLRPGPRLRDSVRTWVVRG
ncbi:MAG: hypothetical protein ABT15_28625 [Pseudonocardia sp. SCN 73-27]|nr:MAG: hypothetical protein ABT15_28625 [Pseudonocardia sp. SCN 73-27]